MRGIAALTFRSGQVLRGLKYLDDAVIGNYVFNMDTASQQNIQTPAYVSGTAYSVTIPASDASDLGVTWVADLEIDGESTGTCSP